MPTLSPSSADIRDEVATLESELANAEREARNACKSNLDLAADQLRSQLAQRKTELLQAEQIEAQQSEADWHQQQLAQLLALENEICEARSQIDGLKKQIAELPGQLNRAQFRHSQLLRARSELKKGLA
jgi:chromosome segregation ATPase